MIVKFLKDTELNGRKYLAGESREFDVETADRLIADGDASLPEVKTEKEVPEIPKKSKKK